MAKKIAPRYLFITLFIFPVFVKAQSSNLSSVKQLLLPQLSLNYYTVLKEGLADKESSLIITSKKKHLNGWLIITKIFGDNIAIDNPQWIDKRDIKAAVVQLANLHGIEYLKLRVLPGAYYALKAGLHQKDRNGIQFLLKTGQGGLYA